MSGAPVRPILVCGAGAMGHGIAQVAAVAGRTVRLYEPEAARAAAGAVRIAENLARAAERGLVAPDVAAAAPARVTPVADLAAAAAGIDVAIEAIVEDADAKRALFAALDRAAPPDALLLSNTSSIPIGRIAEAVAPARRPRVAGMHFFNPVPAMPLVEVVRGPETDDATAAAVGGLAVTLGKETILSADRPGFLVNRMLMPFLAEAMCAFEEGVGTAEAIDAGARLGLGHPMGPLALADRIGLDVLLSIMEIQAAELGAPHHAPPAILRRLVAEGRLGRKSGAGFYPYR
ncbi:MAG: 3-hydroxyacyl-CoA dehydrogenase family protein [Chloroflexota bacterium]